MCACLSASLLTGRHTLLQSRLIVLHWEMTVSLLFAIDSYEVYLDDFVLPTIYSERNDFSVDARGFLTRVKEG